MISFKHVNKIYPSGVTAVSDFCLDIKDKEFIVLVGPSGSGKTTVLRMLAGLEEVTLGQITVDGRIINNLAPKARGVAMVFQRYALFPHYTVYQNIAIGARAIALPKAEADDRIREVAEFLGISELLARKPNTLSGGQRQRVALARAIVRKPEIFLLDEPLSNLDAKLRTEMRSEIFKIKNRLQTTFVYVTHDQTEAMTMADRIVVMNEGKIQQVGTPSEIYNNPANKFVASFIGSPTMNFLDSETFSSTTNKELLDKLKSLDSRLEVGIRAEDIYCHPSADLSVGLIETDVIIDFIEETGSDSIIHTHLTANQDVKLTIKIKSGHALKATQQIKAYLDPSKFHFFKKESLE